MLLLDFFGILGLDLSGGVTDEARGYNFSGGVIDGTWGFDFSGGVIDGTWGSLYSLRNFGVIYFKIYFKWLWLFFLGLFLDISWFSSSASQPFSDDWILLDLSDNFCSRFSLI